MSERVRRSGTGASTPLLDLRPAEREVLGVATAFTRGGGHDDRPADAYLDALPGARAEVRDRFVRGLVRERPPGLPDPWLAPPADPPVDAPAAVRAAVADAGADGGADRVAALRFPASERVLTAPLGTDPGFDRYRVGEPVRLHGPDGTERPADAVAVFDHVAAEGAVVDADHADRMRTDLAESAANLALARIARRRLAAGIDPDAGTVLNAIRRGVRAASEPAALERIAVEGHPTFPSGKMRRGLDPGDTVAYAPEFTARIDLRFAAVRRDAVQARDTGGPSLTDRLYAAFDGLRGAVDDATGTGDYAVVPVHPWQFANTLPDLYADRIDDGTVVPIPDYTWPASPLLNHRTVVPAGTDAPRLKLPVRVQLTSVVRVVSPKAVANGPMVSRVLDRIGEREPLASVGTLAESATAGLHPSGGPHVEGESFDAACNLSAVARDRPESHPLAARGRVVPATTLLADAPHTGRPVVRELVAERAERAGTSLAGAARAFVDDYADALVPDQITLLTKYGVALSGHLQNTNVVLDDGRPTAALLHDFGGGRFHHDRLAPHGFEPEFYPGSDLPADDADDMRRKLGYALFQNHLGHLLAALSRTTPVDEEACWATVRRRCETAFDRLREDPDVPAERVTADRDALFAPRVPHKALTTMRLRDQGHELEYADVGNPLARPDD